MFDIEMLRIEKLVEEREAYENSFFSMNPMLKNEELYGTTVEFTQEIIGEVFDFEEMFFEPIDDNFDNLRDEQLIKEREKYEIEYFENLIVESVEMDLLDYLIESYEEPDYSDFDFEMYDDDYFDDYFDDYYVEEPDYLNRPSCGYDLDYMPNDNLFDYLDCYDYPDSPNENLNGIIFSF